MLEPRPDRRFAGGAAGLQRSASAAPELRRCARQPRPCQSEERIDQKCDRRFRRRSQDQPAPDLLALWPRPCETTQRRGFGRRVGRQQREGHGPEYCEGICGLWSTLRFLELPYADAREETF